MCILTDVFDLDLTGALDLDLTAVRCSVIVLYNLHTREMLLSFPAADVAAHCSSVLPLCCYAVLHKCNWSGYVITG